MPGPEYGILGLIFGIVIIVYAVLLFLLPFYVRRIQNEVIALNRTHSRVLAILESVVKNKKPQS
jgi:hypothetical protein